MEAGSELARAKSAPDPYRTQVGCKHGPQMKFSVPKLRGSSVVQWRALHMRRLAMALVVSPLTPIVLVGAYLSYSWFSPEGLRHTDMTNGLLTLVVYGAAGEVWALVIGSIAVFGICRYIGKISRMSCLLLGVLGTASFPSVAMLAIDALFASRSVPLPTAQVVSAVLFIGSLGGIPLGLLGGWIFWRLGVRPPLLHNVAPVFD